MGDWRIIQITGTCAQRHIKILDSRIRCPDSAHTPRDSERWNDFVEGPLSMHPKGNHLPGSRYVDWVRKTIDYCGLCFERNYTLDDIEHFLWKLAGIAPSLCLKVHCGGDFQNPECIATFHLIDGHVSRLKPEIVWLPV